MGDLSVEQCPAAVIGRKVYFFEFSKLNKRSKTWG